MNNVKFSIIVVTLNTGAAIVRTINSINRQQYSNYEVIIKDGVSTDDTLSYIPNSEKYRICVKSDISIYDAMNQALDKVTGDYVIFMNSGDIFYNDTVLEELALYIEDNNLPNPSVLYGDYSRAGMYIKKQESKLTDFVLYRHPICHQTLVYSSKIFQNNHRYDTQYKISADHDLTLRLWTEHIPFYHTGTVICDYEGDGVSESDKGLQTAIKEKDQITKNYFPKRKLILYNCIYLLTFPHLRKLMVSKSSPKILDVVYNKVRNLITT